jgi:hypothetical protein
MRSFAPKMPLAANSGDYQKSAATAIDNSSAI